MYAYAKNFLLCDTIHKILHAIHSSKNCFLNQFKKNHNFNKTLFICDQFGHFVFWANLKKAIPIT